MINVSHQSELHTVETIQRNGNWETVVWDDPINLMSYVVYVFKKHFGFTHTLAEKLMLEVHNHGYAIVARGTRETMEMHAEAMHGYGLWATVRQRE